MISLLQKETYPEGEQLLLSSPAEIPQAKSP